MSFQPTSHFTKYQPVQYIHKFEIITVETMMIAVKPNT